MLVACPECHRQFDVSGIQPGEQIRCLCSKLVVVPKTRVHEARMLHCSSCGGKLREHGRECEYCGCEVSAIDRNIGDACPECFARLAANAKFCRECGIAIRPERLRATPTSSTCPRCEGSLVLCTLPEGGQYTECSSCGGLWLEESSFDQVVDQKDHSPIGKAITSERKISTPEAPPDQVRYLKCPVCAHLMHRKNFGGCSGVIIDWCKGHGFWFDTHELEKVIHFVAAGGMDKAREREIHRQKRELERAKQAREAVSQSMRSGHGYHPATLTSSRPGDISLTEVISFVGGSLRKFLNF